MKGFRPVQYEILDLHEPPPLRRRFHQGRNGRNERSLRSVAQRAEMKHGILSQVKTGKRPVVADALLRLADVLDEDREELLVRDGFLPASALANRSEYRESHLTAIARQWIDALRAQPDLMNPRRALLSYQA